MTGRGEDGGRPLTGRKVLMIAVGAFAVIAGVNIYMMTRAIEGFPGLVVDSSYRAGIGFDARRAAQEALGWRMSARYEDGGLVVDLIGRDGAPVRGLDVSAVIGRPATANEDRALDLAPAQDGYAAQLALAPGLWRVVVSTASPTGAPYEAAAEILVAPEAAAKP